MRKKKETAVTVVTSLEEDIKPIDDAIEKIKSEIGQLQNSVSDHVRSYILSWYKIVINYII